MGDNLLYHLVQTEVWKSCTSTNTAYYPTTYEQDGFIHLTKEPAVLLTVANHFYTDVPGDYIVLAIDASKLNDKVVFEPAAPVGNKPAHATAADQEAPLFPHLYGTINFDSVVEQLPVEREAGSGRFLKICGEQFS